MMEILHAILPIFIVIAAIFAIYFRDLISATIALAAMSLILSLEFYILQAPDVAIA
ncbi:MAG: hydrogenase, partial [Thermoplasmata archaeon]